MALRGDILRRLGDVIGPEHVTGGNTAYPGSSEEVAAVLQIAAGERLTVVPLGSASQVAYTRPAPAAELYVRMRRMNRIRQYSPGDLTASMEAGISAGELATTLAGNRQWLPVGVARPECATIGGVVATNASGPWRHFYGTARDYVIGLRFATSEGKLIKTGGMVVKNVAGYDMAKLIIGSWGTLGIVTEVNVKVFPHPPSETALMGFDSLAAAMDARTALLKSPLSPTALDLLDRGAAGLLDVPDVPAAEYTLAIAYAGVPAVIERTRRELSAIGNAITLAAAGESRLWGAVCDLPATVVAANPDSVRVRVSSTVTAMRSLLERLPGGVESAVVARAGSGISYLYARGDAVPAFCRDLRNLAAELEAFAVIEYAPPQLRAQLDWPAASRDNAGISQKLKQAFDPQGILNPGPIPC